MSAVGAIAGGHAIQAAAKRTASPPAPAAATPRAAPHRPAPAAAVFALPEDPAFEVATINQRLAAIAAERSEPSAVVDVKA
jgi:hypothetical protein